MISLLRNLTSTRLIQLNQQASDWEEAVRLAAAPLVREQKILESYVDDIIKGVREYGPYIVLTRNVALPHARPEAGALEDTIGITTLDTPVAFGNEDNDPVRYLFCLSATDDTKHLQGLVQLADLLEDRTFLSVLYDCTDPEQVMNYLESLD